MTWTLVLGFLKTVAGNKYAQLVLVGLVLAGGGYFVGRYAQPAKTITKEKTVTVEKERVVFQDRIVIKEVKVKDKKQNRHVETITEKKPDGTVITKTVSDTKTDTKTNTNTDTTEDKTKTVERVVEKVVEKTKVVEAKKNDWIIHGGVGVSIPTLMGSDQQGIPGLKGAVIQLGIDRRVVGPFYLGLFGDSQGVAGLRLSGVF
jgi:hypothetical protein